MSPASERDIAEQRVLDARAAEAALRAEFLRQARADSTQSVERGDEDAGEREGIEQVLSAMRNASRHPVMAPVTVEAFPDEFAAFVAMLDALREKAESNRIAYCTHCGEESVRYSDGASDEDIQRGWDIANAHDRVCPKNPLVQELTALRAAQFSAGAAEALLMAFLEGAGIEVNICGRDGRPLTVESVREIGAFYAKLMARPTDEAPLPITTVQVRAALALAESQPASTDATDLSISLEHLLRWIESDRQYPRPAREAPTSARTDDRRENDRHPARPL